MWASQQADIYLMDKNIKIGFQERQPDVKPTYR